MRREQNVRLEPDAADTTASPEPQVARGLDTRRVSAPALRRFGDLYLQELVITVVALAMILFFTVDSPDFFTSSNAAALASFIAPIAFFALAEVPILILGEIDLSSAFGVRLNWPACSERSTITRLVIGGRGCHSHTKAKSAVSRCGDA